MRYNSESLEIKDLGMGNNFLLKDIKISLGLLITARKKHAEFGGNRNFGLSTTANNRIMIFVIETKIPNETHQHTKTRNKSHRLM